MGFLRTNTARQKRPTYEPSEQERDWIREFGSDHTPFLEIRRVLEDSGLPEDRQQCVWDAIREQRVTNFDFQGKERNG